MRAAEDLLRAWVDSDRGVADGRFVAHELVEHVGLVVAWKATGVDLLTATQVKCIRWNVLVLAGDDERALQMSGCYPLAVPGEHRR